MTDHTLVITTHDDPDAALALAESLVEARLAACAQLLGPLRSVYRWEGKITTATEWQLHVKTTTAKAPAVTDHLVTHHGYDVPEVITIPITGGNPAYLDWVSAETS